MTLSLTQANTFTSAATDLAEKAAPAAQKKKTLVSIAKRFWDYTDAASEANTKSFEGLL